MTDPRAEARLLAEALRLRLDNARAAGVEGVRSAPRTTHGDRSTREPRAVPSPAGRSGEAESREGSSPVEAALPFAAHAKRLPPEERAAALEKIASEVRACTRCRLCEGRLHAVPGEGSSNARILFVGEAPGRNEDEQGRPFVGRAGELLTKIVEKGMGVRREDVFIANVIKCRPPENREPRPDEVAMCLPYLRRQVETLDPAVVIPLGRLSAAAFLETTEGITKLRGRVYRREGRAVVPTFHPAYLLRSPSEKPKVWHDIQLAMAEAGLARP